MYTKCTQECTRNVKPRLSIHCVHSSENVKGNLHCLAQMKMYTHYTRMYNKMYCTGMHTGYTQE